MYENKKIILFDGSNLDGWAKRDGSPADWTIEDGIMTVGKDDIVSKVTFGDALLHVEFREPDMPLEKGQGKGNSGVYVHGCYEIQVLDSYGVEPPTDSDCSAIYNMHAPLMNACKPALAWQTYDILIRAPRFNARGKVKEDGRISVFKTGCRCTIILSFHARHRAVSAINRWQKGPRCSKTTATRSASATYGS